MLATSTSVRSPATTAGTVLASAAASIAEMPGAPETLVDVLHRRAFRHYSEGLRQFLAFRLGSVDDAAGAMGKLRAVVSAQPSEELVSPPGVRARLFRHARELAQLERTAAPSSKVLRSLPFRGLKGRRAQEIAEALRAGLERSDAELLELRHARGLAPAEIAFVLGLDVDEVLIHLELATERANAIVRGQRAPRSLALHRLLLDAFALEPEAPADRSSIAGGWEGFEQGTVIGGRYLVEARVGKGAFGDVYRATDTEVPGHVVALKLLHQPAHSDVARRVALRELHLIASVFHPSVVQFKDHGWFQSRLWFVMPWYEGETLEARLERGALPRAEARTIFEPLARALAAMHAVGIRHQDVKPDNIFLARIPGFGEDDVLPVLLDLGVAAKEAEMVIAGTPTYFAPEVAAQFAHEKKPGPVTSKADVFALALALRNALEPDGRDDIPAGQVDAFIAERAKTRPTFPAARSLRYLAPSFTRWLSVDPEARPSADELAEELAVLTAPEDRRDRRRAVLRWLVPTGIAVITAFGSVAGLLHHRAELQRLEAARARVAATGLREDLETTTEEKRRLERQYAEGQLSRRDLARELASTIQSLHITEADLGRRTTELERAAANVATLERSLASATASVASLEQKRTELERAQEQLVRAQEQQRVELARVRAAIDDAERQEVELRASVSHAAARLDAEAARSTRLEAELRRAITAQVRAQEELARLQREQSETAPVVAPSTQPVDVIVPAP